MAGEHGELGSSEALDEGWRRLAGLDEVRPWAAAPGGGDSSSAI
jgi:hypothetical protein